jgi:threonine/homoserine/homoserine lactone efflux protein
MFLLPPTTFLLAATLLALTPGPGVAYVVARTVAGGKSEGTASCLGTAIGGMAHVVAAALGLSLLVAQSALAYSTLKYLGAAYLIYLGLKALTSDVKPAELPAIERAGARKALRDGIVVEALNVKTAMFFLAFIPQFVSIEHSAAPQFVMLGTICVALNTVVDLVAVYAANRFVGSGTVRVARERLLSRISGVAMLSLGVFVAVARRES